MQKFTCESDELISDGFSVTLLSSGFSSYPFRLSSSELYGTDAGEGLGGDFPSIGGGCCGTFRDKVLLLPMVPIEAMLPLPVLGR